MIAALLDQVAGLIGVPVTAAALHAQRRHFRRLARPRTHYLVTTRQPTRPAPPAQVLPWQDSRQGTYRTAAATLYREITRSRWPQLSAAWRSCICHHVNALLAQAWQLPEILERVAWPVAQLLMLAAFGAQVTEFLGGRATRCPRSPNGLPEVRPTRRTLTRLLRARPWSGAAPWQFEANSPLWRACRAAAAKSRPGRSHPVGYPVLGRNDGSSPLDRHGLISTCPAHDPGRHLASNRASRLNSGL